MQSVSDDDVRKKLGSAKKTCNISETVQDRTTVTIHSVGKTHQ